MCNINELLSKNDLLNHQKAKLVCPYAEFKEFCKNTIVPWIKKNHIELYNQVYGNKTRKGGNNLWLTWRKDNNNIPPHIPCDPSDKYKEEWKKNRQWNGVFDTPKPCIDSQYITKTERSKNQLEEMLSQHLDINHDINNYCCAGIYLYTFPDGKQYVGQTCKTILRRTDEHIQAAYRNITHDCRILNNKIRQLCGTNETLTLDDFRDRFYDICKIEVLYTGDTLLDEKETEFMNKYNTRNGSHGLNIRPGNVGSTGIFNHRSIEMPRGIYKVDKDGREGYYSTIFAKDRTEKSKNFTWNELTMDQKYNLAVELKEFSQATLKDGKRRTQLYTSKEIIDDFCKKYNIPVGSNRPAQFGHNMQFLPDNVYYTGKGYTIKTSKNRGRDIHMYSTKSDNKQIDKQLDLAIEILTWVSKSNYSLDEIDTRPKLRDILKKLYPTHKPGSSRLPLVDLIVQLMNLRK